MYCYATEQHTETTDVIMMSSRLSRFLENDLLLINLWFNSLANFETVSAGLGFDGLLLYFSRTYDVDRRQQVEVVHCLGIIPYDAPLA